MSLPELELMEREWEVKQALNKDSRRVRSHTSMVLDGLGSGEQNLEQISNDQLTLPPTWEAINEIDLRLRDLCLCVFLCFCLCVRLCVCFEWVFFYDISHHKKDQNEFSR